LTVVDYRVLLFSQAVVTGAVGIALLFGARAQSRH
jgi:hypothetical protein